MASDPFVQAFAKLSTPNVSDALDRLGLVGAPHGILPRWAGCPKIAGRAMTVKLLSEGSESPVVGTLRAIEASSAGDVLVIAHDGRMDVNSFGGIAAFTSIRRGLVGVVIDGVTRDIDEIELLRFPAYAKGIIQQSVRDRCAFGGHGGEVRLAGVPVRRDDLIVADDNGVVIVPGEHVSSILKLAEECQTTEERVKDWIAQGVDPIEAHGRAKY